MPTDINTQAREQEILAKQANFARGYSPLYSTLLDRIASWLADPGQAASRLGHEDLVGVCERLSGFILDPAWNNSLEPTLRLGAAMHARVLDKDPATSQLADFYPSVGGSLEPTDASFEAVLADALVKMGASFFDQAQGWRVKTNETSRGVTWLLPAVIVGAEAAYLVELGASAGLNLYAEQRAYDLTHDDGTRLRLGRATDPQFEVALGGESLAEVAKGDPAGPEILGRYGCDSDPVDAAREAGARTLTACVWGDQSRRVDRLREALEVHRQAVRGDLEPRAQLTAAELPHGVTEFLESVLPKHPVAPVISFNSYVTAYFNDVDHRALARRLGAFARAWSLQHHLPWMWVRFEPPRVGDPPAPEPGWCRWRVDLWEGADHHEIDLGWAHPHLVRARLGPGLVELAKLRDPE